jgi:hypothetical protein
VSEEKGDAVARVGRQVQRHLDGLLGGVEPGDLFVTLDRNDDRVVFGAAAIERAGGFGFGAGEGEDDAGEKGAGGGGGGGGSGRARPIAIVEVTSAGVKVWPVIDYTKLGLVAVGVLAAMWKAMR